MNNGVKQIAVIGSGVAGLTATHILQRKHHVTLIEKSERIGGHTNTVRLPDGPDAGTPVDTGFIVMNHRNYPLFTKLLDQLEVDLRDSDMSFGYHDIPSGLAILWVRIGWSFRSAEKSDFAGLSSYGS